MSRHGGSGAAPAAALMLAPVVLNLVLLLPSGQQRPGTAVTLVGLVGIWIFAGGGYALARSAGLEIGMRAPGRRGWLVAVGLGVVLMLAVPVLSMIQASVTASSPLGSRGPAGIVLAGVITAAVTEEVLFRGVGVTALEAVGVPTWAAALVSLFAFALTHIATWPAAHVLFVVLPLGAVLTWCYTRFRNLPMLILAHALVDAPLVFLALAG